MWCISIPEPELDPVVVAENAKKAIAVSEAAVLDASRRAALQEEANRNATVAMHCGRIKKKLMQLVSTGTLMMSYKLTDIQNAGVEILPVRRLLFQWMEGAGGLRINSKDTKLADCIIAEASKWGDGAMRVSASKYGGNTYGLYHPGTGIFSTRLTNASYTYYIAPLEINFKVTLVPRS